MLKEFFAYYRPHRALFLVDFGCAVLSGLLELGFPMAVKAFVDLLLPRGDATALVREIQQLVREGSPVRVHVSARRLPDERRPAMPAAQLMAQWQPGEKEG